MKLVSFNVFRTLGLAADSRFQVSYIKPQEFARSPALSRPVLESADWILFPEYWQFSALACGLDCQVFPSQNTYLFGHDKIETTRVCQLMYPHNIPETRIAANTPEEAARIWEEMSLPFIAKLPKASQGEGVWLISNRQDWLDYLSRTDRLYVQEYLPIDRDLRIVLVGEDIIATYWRHQSDRSFHTNVSRGGQVSYSDIPESAVALVRDMARTLKINHAGFDVAMVGNHPYMLEFNRLFGNQGIPGGGKTIDKAMSRYLQTHTDHHRPLNPRRPRPQRCA